MSDWKETTLGVIPIDWNIVNFIDSIDIKNGQVNPTKIPYLDMLHIGSENIEQNSGRLINIKTNRQKNISSGNYYFTGDDILYSKIRPYFNKVALPYYEGTCSADVYPLRPKNKYFDKKFLFYFLLSDFFLTQAISFQDRTGIPKINREQLGVTLLLNPSLPEQKRIADILSCLDAKIDNLRRQNETLEEIARSIFKHWFMDFEFPDADGKSYKSSGGAMVRSELGDIPEGWQVGKLGKLTKTITKGTTPTTFKKDFVDSGINFIKVESISGDHTLDRSKFAYIDEETNTLLKRSIVQAKDILYTIAGTIGRYVMVTASSLPANTNQAVAIIRPDFDKIDPEYLLCYFASINYKHYLSSRIVQAVQANLSLGVLSDSPVTIPDKKIRNGFREAVKPIFSKKESNQREIQTLTKTRDALLPKLMSGQLRVKE